MRCSNNQAEQIAILKAVDKLSEYNYLPDLNKSAIIYTDSKITLLSLSNPDNHLSIIEEIKQQIRCRISDNWTIHFSWVKAHVGIFGNELADRLAKKAAFNNEIEEVYKKVPKSAVLSDVFNRSVQEWQSDWGKTTNGAVTKCFFPNVKDRLSVNLKLSGVISTFLTGHGKLKEYFYRFKIIDSPICLCNKDRQTVNHLLWECEILND